MTTIHEFIASNKISAEVSPTDHNPHMDGKGHASAFAEPPRMDHWRVLLQRPGRRMSTYFSKGAGHNGKPAEAAEVLDCLASDSAGVENARSFEEWAGEYGYDTDSRKAHRTYTVCKRQAERLRKFLGDAAYEALLWETERL